MADQERLDFIEAQRRMLERYGVSAQSRYVEIPSIGGRAHALVAGDGPPVLMVNGIGTPGAMWAPLMAHLGGFRLHALDLPAYGLTDTTPGLADDLRSNAVRFLDEAVQALGLDRAAFVGNSMGSLWASWLALDRPHRVAALVHLGCPAVVLETSAPLPMRLLSARPLGRLLTRLQPPSPRQVEQLGRMVGEHPLPPELVDLLVATERLPGFRQTFLSTLHVLVRLRGNRPAHRLTTEELGSIRQPTLLLWGADDPFGSPAVGERVAAVMPSAELRIVEGGHCPWLKHANSIGPVVTRFLHEHA
jgi:pimeloyl-ACP methyl ester carboxylesterase